MKTNIFLTAFNCASLIATRICDNKGSDINAILYPYMRYLSRFGWDDIKYDGNNFVVKIQNSTTNEIVKEVLLCKIFEGILSGEIHLSKKVQEVLIEETEKNKTTGMKGWQIEINYPSKAFVVRLVDDIKSERIKALT